MTESRAFCSEEQDSNTTEDKAFAIDPRERLRTTYAQINPVAVVEFAPSRETRESENVTLREHSSPNSVIKQASRTGASVKPTTPRKRPSDGSIRYTDVEFCYPSSRPKPLTSGSVTKPDLTGEVAGTAKSRNYENLLRRIPVPSNSSPASGGSTPSPPHTPPASLKFGGRVRDGRDDYEPFVLGSRTPTKARRKDTEETDESKSVAASESSQDLERKGAVAGKRLPKGPGPPVAPRPKRAPRPPVASHPPVGPIPPVAPNPPVAPHSPEAPHTPEAPHSPEAAHPSVAPHPSVAVHPHVALSPQSALHRHVSSHPEETTQGVVSPRPCLTLRKACSEPSLIPTKAAAVLGITDKELISLNTISGSPSLGSSADCSDAVKPKDLECRRDLMGTHNVYSVTSDDNVFQLSYLGSRAVDKTYGVVGVTASQMIFECKDEGVETTVILNPSKVEIRPVAHMDGLSFAIEQIEGIDATTVSSIHTMGFVVVTDDVAMCHVFSAQEEHTVLQLCRQVASLFHSDHHGEEMCSTRETSLECDFHCKYIGMAPVTQPHGVLLETIDALLHNKDPTCALSVQMTINNSVIVFNKLNSPATDHLLIHNTEDVKALGLFDLDSRVVGYILDTENGCECHCFRCPSASASARVVRALRIAVQQAFKAKEEDVTSTSKKEENGSSLGKFVSRIRRWGSSYTSKPSPRSHFYTTLSTESYRKTSPDEENQPRFERRSSSSFFVSLEKSSPDSDISSSVPVFSPTSSTESNAVSPVKSQSFSVVYVGSSKTEAPPSGQMVMDLLMKMEKEGATGGLAGDGKAIIQIRLSPHSVILLDANQKVFFRRHYSRRVLVGLARHCHEKDIFGLWTRSGGESELKCHIFRRAMHPVTSIVQAFQQYFELECT